MSSDQTVSVNFGEPVGLFPLQGVSLLPHGILPLHVFEPRYRQLVEDAIDNNRQFAMATLDTRGIPPDALGRPHIRPIVCIGMIVECGKTNQGTYMVLLQGLCRGRIVEELPGDTQRLYRRAILEEVDAFEREEQELEGIRRRLTMAFEHEVLRDLRGSQDMLKHLKNPEIPTSAIVEVMGFTFLNDAEQRYRLLASEDPLDRAIIVQSALFELNELLRLAQPQRNVDTPKGCHWN